MDEILEAQILHEANEILLARNEALVEALGDMLKPEPTPAQRQRAIEVWRHERGVPLYMEAQQ